jgi:hypothetical protein
VALLTEDGLAIVALLVATTAENEECHENEVA